MKAFGGMRVAVVAEGAGLSGEGERKGNGENSSMSVKTVLAAIAPVGTVIAGFYALADNNKSFQRTVYQTFDLDPVKLGLVSVSDDQKDLASLTRGYEDLKSALREARGNAVGFATTAFQQELQTLRAERDQLRGQNDEKLRLLRSQEGEARAFQARISELEKRITDAETQARQSLAGTSATARPSARSTPISYSIEAANLSGQARHSYMQANLNIRFSVMHDGETPLRWAVWGSNRAMASTDVGLSFQNVEPTRSTTPYCYGVASIEGCRPALRQMQSGANFYTLGLNVGQGISGKDTCSAAEVGKTVVVAIPVVYVVGNELKDLTISGRVNLNGRISAEGCS